MKRISNFKNFEIINESAPRIPVSLDYWTNKGKKGKVVGLYTHDDLDGIASAIEVKKYLLNKGFTIEKYGILNYSEGWKSTSLDPELINIVVDFANMPGDERDKLIDFYLDHHGLFSEEEKERYKMSPVQKKKTDSAYEAVCQSLGVPQDELVLSVIDMIDSAKYEEYGVSWQRLLDFNISDIKKSENKRLEFAAAFNQFIKRGDSDTLIEVIENCKDVSIYSIFNTMKKLYAENNIITKGPKTGQKKDFIEDSTWRQGEMIRRTRGTSESKKVYQSMTEFMSENGHGNMVGQLDGYVAIGDLIFIPSGTWANALRARSIVEKDIMDGRLPEGYTPKFILLQYGGTLQVCSYKKLEDMDESEYPVLKNGSKVDNLGSYMSGLLENFQKHMGYHDPDTTVGQDEITVSGGHVGIGSVSNIFGKYEIKPGETIKYVDMFKNKIISDLSGVKFNSYLIWSVSPETKTPPKPMNHRVRYRKDLKKINPETGEIGKVEEDKEYGYGIVSKDGKSVDKVSKEEFLKAGAQKGLRPDKKSGMTIDHDNRMVVAKFEKFGNKNEKNK